jgi:predicted ABC-type ATPase
MGVITVLAGTNAAGKSSIGGALVRHGGGAYYNPDDETRVILVANPGLDLAQANGLAWTRGLENLRNAIAEGTNYAFETTLGGNTITRTLIEGAESADVSLRVWYCGLASPELHLERVRARVAAGGHDIPADTIRARYDSSRRNLLKLMPHLTDLQVFDNSFSADPRHGSPPRPARVLKVVERHLVYPVTAAHLKKTPAWAKPLVVAAVEAFAGL